MSRFKTELCNNLIELGVCKYGDRCHYAHGTHELRQVARRHPKYRTEKCKNFELTGKCPFGPRCSYVHPKPDLDSMIEQLTRYVQHTRAPKPDFEDDEGDNIRQIKRTATSTSLYSNCTRSTASDINQFGVDEANKENQIVVDHKYNSNVNRTLLHDQAISQFKDKNFELIEDQVTFNTQRTLRPLNLPQQYTSNDQQRPKPIQKPQQRIAMQAISSNNQTANQRQEFTELSLKSHSNFNTDSPPYNVAASDPFAITNPLSDYLKSNKLSSEAPNKQFYTRF